MAAGRSRSTKKRSLEKNETVREHLATRTETTIPIDKLGQRTTTILQQYVASITNGRIGTAKFGIRPFKSLDFTADNSGDEFSTPLTVIVYRLGQLYDASFAARSADPRGRFGRGFSKNGVPAAVANPPVQMCALLPRRFSRNVRFELFFKKKKNPIYYLLFPATLSSSYYVYSTMCPVGLLEIPKPPSLMASKRFTGPSKKTKRSVRTDFETFGEREKPTERLLFASLTKNDSFGLPGASIAPNRLQMR